MSKESVVAQPLQEALATILTKATQGVEAGVQFLSVQLPDVAQQLLAWKMVSACVVAGICFLIIFTFSVLLFRGVSKDWALKDDPWGGKEPNGVGIFLIFGTVFSWLFLLLPLIFNIEEAIQIYFAPKIYLIEYAAKLIK